MLSKKDFVIKSIEINLFFQRIMKEHLFFIETNLEPVQNINISKAHFLKNEFEQLLMETIYYANFVITEIDLNLKEIVTPFTLKVEEITSKLTGGSLNTNITKAQCQLENKEGHPSNDNLEPIIWNLNNRTLNILNETIFFKQELFDLSNKCQIFLTIYQEMIKHDIEEAKHYQELLITLQNKKRLEKTLCSQLNFWNHIMEEHAEFIDGMLDPTEKNLKEKARVFITKFEKLVQECLKMEEAKMIEDSFKTSEEIKDFKKKATEGLINCQIRSVIPPLLADHILREAYHYLRILTILEKQKKK